MTNDPQTPLEAFERLSCCWKQQQQHTHMKYTAIRMNRQTTHSMGTHAHMMMACMCDGQKIFNALFEVRLVGLGKF